MSCAQCAGAPGPVAGRGPVPRSGHPCPPADSTDDDAGGAGARATMGAEPTTSETGRCSQTPSDPSSRRIRGSGRSSTSSTRAAVPAATRRPAVHAARRPGHRSRDGAGALPRAPEPRVAGTARPQHRPPAPRRGAGSRRSTTGAGTAPRPLRGMPVAGAHVRGDEHVPCRRRPRRRRGSPGPRPPCRRTFAPTSSVRTSRYRPGSRSYASRSSMASTSGRRSSAHSNSDDE